MDRKTLTILLSLALIGSFFLPYFGSGSIGVSGFDAVFKSPGGAIVWEKYLWLLVPLPAILLLIGALNNDHYFLGRDILSWMPLAGLIYFIVRLYMNTHSDGVAFSFGGFINLFGVGFWISLVIALMLAFFRGKK